MDPNIRIFEVRDGSVLTQLTGEKIFGLPMRVPAEVMPDYTAVNVMVNGVPMLQVFKTKTGIQFLVGLTSREFWFLDLESAINVDGYGSGMKDIDVFVGESHGRSS